MPMAAIGVVVTPSQPNFGGPHAQAYADGSDFWLSEPCAIRVVVNLG
jgi:hypothetical protein